MEKRLGRTWLGALFVSALCLRVGSVFTLGERWNLDRMEKSERRSRKKSQENLHRGNQSIPNLV